MAGEKTEKATPKRRRDERKKGNIFQSKEVVTVAGLVVTFYGLKFLMPTILSALEKSMTEFIALLETPELTPAVVSRLFISGITTFAVATAPLMLLAAITAIIFTIAQTRGLISFKSIAPKFSRMNPLSGIKRLFSINGIVELLKSIVKIVVVLYIIYSQLKKSVGALPRLMDMSLISAMTSTADIIMGIVQSCIIIFAFLAAADYAWQWWDYEKKLRMSKQEIKEEFKETEGDPQIKGKIRERQQAASRRRMMQAVPTADVVIRNPTHYAVAIRYNPDKDRAPVVVAKGVDDLALRIVKIAEENKVYTTENIPLAHALYDSVDVDAEIPTDFYQAIAELLAFVYNLRKKANPNGL